MDRLEKLGIIDSMEFSDWAAPIIQVLKQDGLVKIVAIILSIDEIFFKSPRF